MQAYNMCDDMRLCKDSVYKFFIRSYTRKTIARLIEHNLLMGGK